MTEKTGQPEDRMTQAVEQTLGKDAGVKKLSSILSVVYTARMLNEGEKLREKAKERAPQPPTGPGRPAP